MSDLARRASDLIVMVNPKTDERRTITLDGFKRGMWESQGWRLLDPPTAGIAAMVVAPDGPPPLETEADMPMGHNYRRPDVCTCAECWPMQTTNVLGITRKVPIEMLDGIGRLRRRLSLQ